MTLLILFPTFFLFKSCYEESVLATDAVVHFVKHNDDIQQLITDHKNSYLFKNFVKYAQSWGWNEVDFDLEKLEEHALYLLKMIGNNVSVFFGSSMSILTNLSNIVVSFIIFSTTLFYIIFYKTLILEFISELSPFNNEEQTKIFDSFKISISKIILCSLIIGVTQFWTTWFSFWVTGLQLKYIFSAIASFLSIVPILSTWIIWVPAMIFHILNDQNLNAFIIALLHLSNSYILNGYVQSYLPGNPHYVGMSIALGLSSFGPIGVLVGPLLASLVFTIIEIYKGFYTKPRRQLTNKDSLNLKSNSELLIVKKKLN